MGASPVAVGATIVVGTVVCTVVGVVVGLVVVVGVVVVVAGVVADVVVVVVGCLVEQDARTSAPTTTPLTIKQAILFVTGTSLKRMTFFHYTMYIFNDIRVRWKNYITPNQFVNRVAFPRKVRMNETNMQKCAAVIK